MIPVPASASHASGACSSPKASRRDMGSRRQNRGAAGQRLGHALDQQEVLGPRQQELPGPIPMGVDPLPDVGQETRRVLDLVVDDRRGEPGEKRARVLERGCAHVGKIERNVRVLAAEHMPQQRGLARLPRPGQHDGRKLRRGPTEHRLQGAPQIGLCRHRIAGMCWLTARLWRSPGSKDVFM